MGHPLAALRTPLMLATALMVVSCQKTEMEQAPPEPPAVQVTAVQPRSLELLKEGRSDAEAGLLFFRFDRAPFEKAVAGAQGGVAHSGVAGPAVVGVQTTVEGKQPR